MKISIKIAAILILLFSCDSVVENNDNESAEYTLTGLWVKDSVKAEYEEGCTEIGFHPGASLFSGSQEFYDLWSGLHILMRTIIRNAIITTQIAPLQNLAS